MQHVHEVFSLRPTLISAVGVAALLVAACGGADDPTPASEASAGDPPAAQAPTAAPADDLAPATSRDTGTPGVEIAAPGAIFTLPGHWNAEAPSSTMRLAQASIPGDAGDATLTVFYFGPGMGGGTDANLERWAGQMQVAEGAEVVRDQASYGVFTVTWIDIEGTLMPSTMGVGPTEPQPDSRLLGAVVEGPQGPWFFKATGPSATLAAERDAFLALVMSGRASS